MASCHKCHRGWFFVFLVVSIEFFYYLLQTPCWSAEVNQSFMLWIPHSIGNGLFVFCSVRPDCERWTVSIHVSSCDFLLFTAYVLLWQALHFGFVIERFYFLFVWVDDDIKIQRRHVKLGKQRVEEAICHNRTVSGWYGSHRAVHRVSPKRGTNTKWSGKNSWKWWLVWRMALCTQALLSLWLAPVWNDKRENSFRWKIRLSENRWKIWRRCVEYSFSFWCSTWQWKPAGKNRVKQDSSQKLDYTRYVEA